MWDVILHTMMHAVYALTDKPFYHAVAVLVLSWCQPGALYTMSAAKACIMWLDGMHVTDTADRATAVMLLAMVVILYQIAERVNAEVPFPAPLVCQALLQGMAATLLVSPVLRPAAPLLFWAVWGVLMAQTVFLVYAIIVRQPALVLAVLLLLWCAAWTTCGCLPADAVIGMWLGSLSTFLHVQQIQ